MWKSNKLSKLKVFALSIGGILVSLIIILELFTMCYSSDDTDIPDHLNPQNEPALPYSDEDEQQQPTPPPESPPPSYDQVMQQIGRT